MTNVISPDRFKRSSLASTTEAASDEFLAALSSEGIEIDRADPLAGMTLNPARPGERVVGTVTSQEAMLLAIGLGWRKIIDREDRKAAVISYRAIAAKIEAGAEGTGDDVYVTDQQIAALMRATDLSQTLISLSFTVIRERLGLWCYYIRVAEGGKIVQGERRVAEGLAQDE